MTRRPIHDYDLSRLVKACIGMGRIGHLITPHELWSRLGHVEAIAWWEWVREACHMAYLVGLAAPSPPLPHAG